MADEEKEKAGGESMEKYKVKLFSSYHPPYIYIFPPPCLFARGNGKIETMMESVEYLLEKLQNDKSWKEIDF